MLRGIAEFAMRGRWYAAIAAAMIALAAMMLPPLTYLASGILALTTLRMGPKEGLKVVVATMAVFTLTAAWLFGQFEIALLFLLSSWLPVFLAVLVLGYTRSLAAGIVAAVGIGLIFVLAMYTFVAEPALWWQQTLQPLMEALLQQPGWSLSQSDTQTLITEMAGILTGIAAAGVTLNVILGLVIGRAWQAMLYNPGGFADEFRQLKLGKKFAAIAVALMIISVLPVSEQLSLLVDCLPAVLIAFAVQGLAVVHALIKQRQKPGFWLVIVYLLLVVMMPQMVVILATTGVLEQWMNFRRHSNG
jgi:hypothetical protein